MKTTPTKRQTTSSTDAATAKDLLLWARQNRIALAQVIVGSVSLVVTMDHRLQHVDGNERNPSAEARQSIIEQYGGALFNPPAPEEEPDAEVEPTEQDDDDE